MAAKVIVIAGGSGSGKSSLASRLYDELKDWYRVGILSEDAYYRQQSELTLKEREQTNYDHPDAVEEALLVQHLASLKAGQQVDVPVYDYEKHDRSEESVSLGPCQILIVEGILLLHREAVRKISDLTVFVDVPESVCFQRRIKRDVSQRGRTRESVIDQYEKTVRPMFNEFVEPSKQFAQLVIENGNDQNNAQTELMRAVRDLLV